MQSAPAPSSALDRSPRALPPGPRGSLGVGSLFETWKKHLTLMSDGCRDFGAIAHYKFAWLRYVVVADPNAAHHVLVENHKNYVKSQNYQGLKILLGEGLLTSEGDFWKRQRKLSQPAFHRERLAGFVSAMVDCTADVVARWESSQMGTMDVHREMMRLTFRIVGKTLLSMDLDGEAKAVGEALDVALHWANDYVESVVRIPPWIPTPKNVRFGRAKSILDSLVLRAVTERRAAMARGESVPGDLLQMLLESRDADTGAQMTDEQLKHELLTLILAGHETTANALAFSFWLLAEHPAVLAELRREVDTVLGDRDPTLADIPKLAYAQQVIDESMRLYPPVWAFERQALSDDVIGGFHVPKGTIVGISPYVMQRRSELFSDPLTFDPSRFDKAKAQERHKHAYLPFGGGPRTCIGNMFAMMEMQIVLAMVARRFDFTTAPGFELELEPAVTLRPKHGIPMTATPRASVAAGA
ncbi:hypothetical protein BH09MYX1_BH09MYX1_12860 [soil metagenome]